MAPAKTTPLVGKKKTAAKNRTRVEPSSVTRGRHRALVAAAVKDGTIIRNVRPCKGCALRMIVAEGRIVKKNGKVPEGDKSFDGEIVCCRLPDQQKCASCDSLGQSCKEVPEAYTERAEALLKANRIGFLKSIDSEEHQELMKIINTMSTVEGAKREPHQALKGRINGKR